MKRVLNFGKEYSLITEDSAVGCWCNSGFSRDMVRMEAPACNEMLNVDL